MGVYEGKGALTKAMKELTYRWHEARSAWNDARTREFEEEYMNRIESDLKTALAAMDHMAVLIAQARRDCE
jgi:hypothetical protein